MSHTKTGIIILAAGASTRLGQPKQKLLYQGQSLLQHALQTAVQSGCAPIIVVLGANAETIASDLNQPDVQVVVNEAWPEGMASSIRCGLAALEKVTPGAESVIFMVCDQPFVSASLLNQLVAEVTQNAAAIVAAAYQNTMGTPVLSRKNIFRNYCS